ncbi:MAG: type II toxin-antitoxin system PemK/MazF family toxin, partial [Methanobacteriota archaeon]
MKGKFVLVPFPFTDLTASKLRPALVLYDGRKDVVVAFISSRIPDKIPRAGVKIPKDHEEFGSTGLKAPSIIRLDKVATVLKDLVIGELGEAGPKLK